MAVSSVADRNLIGPYPGIFALLVEISKLQRYSRTIRRPLPPLPQLASRAEQKRTSTMELITKDSVCVLTMSGTGAFNAGSLEAFNKALDAVLAQEDAEVLVLTGQEKNFSQGLDLDYVISLGDPEVAMSFVHDCMKMVGRLLTFGLPVVAAVNGHAFGLGAMITLASDYKVMREDRGYFCLPEADLGMTLTHRMNALVCGKLRGAVLRDVLLAGRRMAGPEALAAEIVDAVCSAEALQQTGIELCAPMRGKNRDALAGLKRGVNVDILKVIEAKDPEATIGN